MKVKALIGFAGEVSMFKGEERTISDEIAAPLLKAGYIEAVTTSADSYDDLAPDKGKKRAKKNENK